MSATRSRRGPGRPVSKADDHPSKRQKILDAAEEEFAESGYRPTSLRRIADRANVNPALIAYYFGSKEGLFETVFKRRGNEIAQRWDELLDALEARPGRAPTVEELIRAYLTAEFELKREGPSGERFVRFQARVHDETDALHFRVRREVYDVATRRYVAALERALPNLDSEEIYWRMMFVIGAFLYMMAGADRLDDLSGGRYAANDVDEIIERLTRFAVGGMSSAGTVLPAAGKQAPRDSQHGRSAGLVRRTPQG